MPQLLHLINGEGLLRKIRAGEGRLGKLLKAGKSDQEIVDELFLATLGRLPAEPARQTVRKAVAGAPSKDEGYRDLFWALLNAKEFSFNH